MDAPVTSYRSESRPESRPGVRPRLYSCRPMREDSDMVYVFVGLFFTIFGGLNYYVGARGWQWLQSFTPVPVSAATYWAVFWLIALSFMVTRLTAGALPPAVTTVLAHVSAWWMAVFTIAVQVLLVVDIVRLLGRVAVAVAPQLAPARLLPDVNLVQVTGTVVCAAVVALVAFGAWRARTPVVTSYTVDIPKAAGPYSELHIVVVSDLHLGEIVGNSRIRRLAGIVGDLDPDLVLIPGDLIDDDLRPFIARGMAAELAALRPRLGTYASLGNHDPTPDRLAAYREALAPAGIKLLADEYVLVDDAFYIAARHDSALPRRAGIAAQPLPDVLAGVDRTRPIILMDHQPNRLGEAAAAGVDLQVSGHTHRGQIFPGNLVTRAMYELDWGYLQKGTTHFVVTVGYGTWGPPIRIGNRPEVVSITVRFSPREERAVSPTKRRPFNDGGVPTCSASTTSLRMNPTC